MNRKYKKMALEWENENNQYNIKIHWYKEVYALRLWYFLLCFYPRYQEVLI